jgi:hypothetical protein
VAHEIRGVPFKQRTREGLGENIRTVENTRNKFERHSIEAQLLLNVVDPDTEMAGASLRSFKFQRGKTC